MITIHIVDAFTTEAESGNRAGVVFGANGLTEDQMQAAAAFAGFSETAFVLEPDPNTDSNDVHVRYFTPTTEVPICGHATIATHFLRAQRKGLTDTSLLAKTGAGTLPVGIEGQGQDRKIIMTQGEPVFGDIIEGKQKETLIAALGLEDKDLVENLPVQIVSTGHSKVMIPIKNTEKLDILKPSMHELSALSEEIGCNGYFTFAIDNTVSPLQTFGRMFAPAIGIHEDPVTGNANGPAGAYLAKHGILKFDNAISYQGHQGIAMGKPGTIEVRLTKSPDGKLATVQVAGKAVEAGTLEFNEASI